MGMAPSIFHILWGKMSEFKLTRRAYTVTFITDPEPTLKINQQGAEITWPLTEDQIKLLSNQLVQWLTRSR